MRTQCDHATMSVMSNFEVVIICVCVLSCCSQCLTVENVECRKTGRCNCVMPDGVRIDLTQLNDDAEWLNATLGDMSFFFHPCSDIPYGYHTGSDDCTSGSSLCLFSKTTNTYQNLGTVEEGRFLFENLKEAPVMLYKHGNITTAVLLLCVYSAQTSFSVVDIEAKQVTHRLKLESIWTCPSLELTKDKRASQNSNKEGLSTGSVLVILFFVFTTLYFVGGAIALKLLRGAEGREMIPNYDFWVDLPNLVRDGSTFVISGCQTTPSYDRI